MWSPTESRVFRGHRYTDWILEHLVQAFGGHANSALRASYYEYLRRLQTHIARTTESDGDVAMDDDPLGDTLQQHLLNAVADDSTEICRDMLEYLHSSTRTRPMVHA